MKKYLRDIVGSLGLVLVAFGAGLVFRPAGVILVGAFLVIVALFGFTADKPQKKVGD